MFWAAINSGDRVDSALKDMVVVMKQLNRSEEVIKTIKSFRHFCPLESQESLDNLLIELYKEILIKALKLHARFLVGRLSTRILAGEEQAENQQKQATPKTESRLPFIKSLNIYVLRDERFGHLKLSDFLANALKSLVQFLLLEFEAFCAQTPDEFDSFQDVLKLYEGGIKLRARWPFA
ncbi:hypothetical protein LguiB_001351 [Lonicera macranthoides]